MLYWNTVTKLLKDALLQLMQAEELKNFRLVGGTALSLQLGHRMSIDIDLFTDAPYQSINFDLIEAFLKANFYSVTGNFGGNAGMGKSYLIGNADLEMVKLDIYYSMDPFFQEAVHAENIRMATLEEIIAMKVDIVQRGGRKKDFWDLHELLDKVNIRNMIALHKKRFEWTHDEELILNNFRDFSFADDEFDPICLKAKEWIFIKEDIQEQYHKEFDQ